MKIYHYLQRYKKVADNYSCTNRLRITNTLILRAGGGI